MDLLKAVTMAENWELLTALNVVEVMGILLEWNKAVWLAEM